MSKCVFTICAKNYVGLACILEESFKKKNPEVDFYIVIADVVTNEEAKSIRSNAISAHEIFTLDFPESQFYEMAFKYNLTEFCTSIKPTCFKYFFQKLDYDHSIYLDPDIYLFASMDSIFSVLDHQLIVVTPHIVTMNANFAGERSETGILSTGIFNLGFLALRNSSKVVDFLVWWESKLKDNCFNDILESTFTDQKWLDFLPTFFSTSELHISFDLGLNLAPWNYFEREVQMLDGEYWVFYRSSNDHILKYKLIFAHFSGFDYKSLLSGDIIQKNIDGLEKYHDANELCKWYSKEIIRQSELFNSFINETYLFNFFRNGIQIQGYHRRLFRSLVNEGRTLNNPFDTDQLFYRSLLQNGMISSKMVFGKFDSLNKHNLEGVDKKVRIIQFFMKFLFFVLGSYRYFLLVRFFRPFSKIENHLFLLNKGTENNLK